MGMEENSVDDDYKNCVKAVSRQIPDMLEKERSQSKMFDRTWQNATYLWEKKMFRLPRGMEANNAIAIIAYSMDSIYRDFNDKTRNYGTRLSDYPCKSLHFLLTRAVKITSKNSKKYIFFRRCFTVFRGTDLNFEYKEGESVRFGQFTSTSEIKEVAEEFGSRTMFRIETCYGASINKYSEFDDEEEVLVPPTEVFQVKGFSGGNATNEIELKPTRRCASNRWCQLFNDIFKTRCGLTGLFYA
ncbi:erythroblast NAD(P)(+)--arginine ADP-ribosyltransferase-like [Latimeria chalumnae]|uniref:erythroblast NAD(P)(+)--arginine ADP-ribosyltransferase-like n=1 Tax=Latimeria chalumnae TaxID=7897 RepID=UPI00313E46A6